MNKKIFCVWLLVLVVAIGTILPGAAMVKNNRQRENKPFQAQSVKGWKIEHSDRLNQQGMYTIHYKNTLPTITEGGEMLMFYVYHGDVYAFVDGEQLYHLNMDSTATYFPVVVGDTWNCFHVPQKYAGKEIEIVVETKYASYLEYMPEFYMGDRLHIVENQFEKSIVSIVLCLLIFTVGITAILYNLASLRKNYRDYGMVYLGVFAIQMSLWFMINTPVLNMLWDFASVFTNLSYLILGTVTVPIILFEKNIMDNKRYGKVCDVLCWGAIIVQIVCVLLQVTGVRDLKQTLVCTHIVFAVSIIGLITLLALHTKNTKFKNFSTLNRINVMFGMVTAVGVAFDMIHYYIDDSHGKNYEFTKLSFLVYIIALSYFSIKETMQLMEKGKEAEKFELMAHRDELTGVLNRMACNEDMRGLDVHKHTYTVCMFDLNNLKRCNDTLGHEFGDMYIINCAKYIQKAFKEVGKCYRIGGDEFCVIGELTEETMVQKCYEELEKLVDVYNKKNPIANMSIARGHAFFDARYDEDLKDTRNRADQSMYRHKMEMKARDVSV